MKAQAPNYLTREEKKLILANHDESKSYSEIAGIVGKPTSIVYRVISRLKADKTLEPKATTDAPHMTTKREGRTMVKISLKDRFDAAMTISRAFCVQTGKPISWKTVSRRLIKEKLVFRIPCHKPLISKKNLKVSLDFATEHILWTEEQWNMVHFSD